MELITKELIQRLVEKGWEKTEKDGVIIMRHPELMGSHSVFDAVRVQKILDAPQNIPRACADKTEKIEK